MSAPVLPAAGYGPNECQLAALSNGSLLMNVRDAYSSSEGYHGRLFTVSHDRGSTWYLCVVCYTHWFYCCNLA
jgi:hypothetical protein